MINFLKNTDYWKTKANVRINTVNCVGISGKGVALDFKNRYPEMFQAYKLVCANGHIRPGELQIFHCNELGWLHYDCEHIINFATKDHWKNPSKIEWIDNGLNLLYHELGKSKYSEKIVSMPALGCGNGGLDWKSVKNLIKERLEPLFLHINMEINVFEPQAIFK